MQINNLNVPPTPDGKPPTYTIVTEWFTLQDVPGPVLDLLGVVLMSIPVPRKYTDPIINTIVQQANDQNMAYAVKYRNAGPPQESIPAPPVGPDGNPRFS